MEWNFIETLKWLQHVISQFNAYICSDTKVFRKPTEIFNKNHRMFILKELYNFYCLINIYTPTRQSTISKHSKHKVYLIHPNHSFHFLIRKWRKSSIDQSRTLGPICNEFGCYEHKAKNEQIPSERNTSDNINVKKCLVTTSTACNQ